ncbi:MAG: aldehyde ferredoxin oxidoreductase C-terminal domain-containing protein [bacterium]
MATSKVKYEKNAPKRGYTDRILEIDLEKKEIKVTQATDELRSLFVGGRGYCLKMVYDGTNADTRYDSPENVLAIAGGPFCGETAFAGTGKFIVGSISPLTNSFCDSNVGGRFFPLVKLSGFDAIKVTGKSDADVMVVIDGDTSEVSFVAAPDMKNSLTGAEEMTEAWKGDGSAGNVSFLCTGEGALHSYYGCINSIYYDVKRKRCRSKQAGRGGMGTIMRDKKLWGILVRCNAKMGGSNAPADLSRVRAVGKELQGVIREIDPQAMRLGHQGTTSLMDMMNKFFLLPVNNYQYGASDKEKNVSGFIFEKNYFKQNVPDGCFFGCNLGCTKGCDDHVLKTGPAKGRMVAVDGPEYETAASATNLGIFDVGDIMDFSWYCDEYGFDTISVGVAMAFVYEAYERGLINAQDVENRALNWGNAEAAMELMHDIAAGKSGLPAEVGRGVRRLKSWVADRAVVNTGRKREDIMAEVNEFGMECKGLEFSMYITKESLAQQGGYGFANKGAQHDEAWLIAIDQIHKELPTFEKKAAALKWFPLFRTWFNIAGLCKLPWIDVRHPEAKNTEWPAQNMPTVNYYVELVNATFGSEKTLDDLLLDSERSYTLHKLINLRQGYGVREHDVIPMRAMGPVYLNEYLSRKEYYDEYLAGTAGLDIAGKSDEEKLVLIQNYRREQYKKLADVVYEEKGYDPNGIPLDETLERLGLTEPGYKAIVRAARERFLAACV